MRPARSPSGEFCPGRSGARGSKADRETWGHSRGSLREGWRARPSRSPPAWCVAQSTRHQGGSLCSSDPRPPANDSHVQRAGRLPRARLAHVLLCARLEPGLRGGPRTGEAQTHRAAPRPPPARSPHRSTSPCVTRLETRPRPGQPGSVPCRAVEGDLPQTSPRTPPWR